jgi:alkylation response protein AidB-like acyl-CoA dehydrogenase
MYHAPLREIGFVLHELLGDQSLAGLYEEAGYSPEIADGILDEAAKFAQNVLLPLNATGDREGAHWSEAGVTTPKGFPEAYKAYVEAGWAQLAMNLELGGQGMPQLINSAVEELMFASNMAFYLGTSLACGAVEAIAASGSPTQQQRILPKMVSGEWMGTMNLTEPQAGSDLALLRTRAVAEDDHYRIFGQKIFITYGDHDLADNIIHLVLARIDGAPAGTRGISLFLVPKRLLDAQGNPGAPNDLRCLSIEHKLGIHASPTCVMAFGEKQGAIGYLLGEPNTGLAHMFIMMNAARLSVGVQGIAQSERALQQALDWARNRLQGRPPRTGGADPAPIIEHADVKRMLLSMKARTEGMRALAYYAAMELDRGHRLPDATARAAALARAELLIPVVKGWCTETGIEVTSTGMQVHGGMGYIEETGAAQFLRDVRIAAIYEGTTGIQANDLIGRKLARDRGDAMNALLRDLQTELDASDAHSPESAAIRTAAIEGIALLRDATEALLQSTAESVEKTQAVAVPYLKLTGLVVTGALMARAAALSDVALASTPAETFYQAKLQTARFYAGQLLPEALALARIVKTGGTSVAQVNAALI